MTGLPIGAMKRAAIDSFMVEQGWLVTLGGESSYSLWGFLNSSYSRPGPEGEGGGEPDGFSEAGESLAPSFEAIRARIDAYIAPWLEPMPDGADCIEPKGNASAAATVLGASGSGGQVLDNGELPRSNEGVARFLTNIHGSFKAPFYDKYFSQFSIVSYGIGAACAILEGNYAGQHTIWPAAQDDVAEICASTVAALQAKADRATSERTKVALTVVGAVAGAVVTIASAGTAGPAVASLVLLSSTAATALTVIEAEAAIAGDSYSDILDSFGAALESLNSGITKQEEALNTMMAGAVDAIGAHPENFNLDAFSLPMDHDTAITLTMIKDDSDAILLDMDRVAGALGDAASSLGSAPATNPTPRDSRIGLTDGTHPKATELYALVARCLVLTKAEYERGRGLFDAAAKDFFDADAEATALVNRLAAAEVLTENI